MTAERKKITAPDIRAMKGGDRKIVMVTAYDYPTARAIEGAGLDAILVGDSLGMVVLGYDSTVPVTMEDMIHHTKAVKRGTETVHLVADMPFMSYEISDDQAVTNAGRLLKEGGADAVKLEGGEVVASRIQAIVRAGIPVMGHVGLTPQTVGSLGGYRVQGRSQEEAEAVIRDAFAVQRAGAYSIVVEAVPRQLGRIITSRLSIPTIGIGAGADCDGQVLVNSDLLGLYDKFIPSFAKRYTDLQATMQSVFREFAEEIQTGAFPAREHGFSISRSVLEAIDVEQ